MKATNILKDLASELAVLKAANSVGAYGTPENLDAKIAIVNDAIDELEKLEGKPKK